MKVSIHRERLKTLRTQEGYQLAFVDEGQGPAILLLHGVPTSSYLYRHIIPLLSAKGRRVIAPDLLGYGASDKPHGYDIYSHELQARRIIELMDFLKIGSWSHVCHDMGGMVTWEIMRTHPEKIAGLVLLNTIIYPEGFCPPIKMKKNILTRWYTNLYCSALLGKQMIAATFKNGLSDEYKLSSEVLTAYALPMSEGSSNALYYFFSQTSIPLPDYAEVLKQVKVPVKIIWGMKDEILVWKTQAARIMRDLNLTSNDVSEIQECKHFIQEEHPQFIADVISSLY